LIEKFAETLNKIYILSEISNSDLEALKSSASIDTIQKIRNNLANNSVLLDNTRELINSIYELGISNETEEFQIDKI